MEALAGGIVIIAALTASVFRADFERYGLLDAGVYPRVERYETVGEKDCIECGEPFEDGEHRAWRRELVCCGVVLRRYANGVHHYCEDHASFEYHQGVPTWQPWWLDPAVSIIALLGAVPDADELNTDETEFSNVSSSVGDAMSLLPLLVAVMVAAAGIHLIQSMQGSLEA